MENKFTDETLDSYTAGIELSNKCREFYQRRVETAENVKQRLSPTPKKERRKSSLDVAMEKLSNEMASLMDQDLSLMRQMLTLNEAIEDLKWQSRNNSRSMSTSSCDLSGSDLSVSDTEMVFHSDDESKDETTNQTTFSSSCNHCSSSKLDNLHILSNNLNNEQTTNTSIILEEVNAKLRCELSDSVDSGINT